ncbi:MAG: SET domain-containing protein [Flavobacteriaceae bacterium]|nr:SET domain-containing protein [Flavobacteriaceae bacterium]
MIFPKTELRFISKQIGYGVVATEFIPKGTITWALDALDREFTPAEVSQMDVKYQKILDFYTYRNNRGNFVFCWDFGRYVNHSFNANCISTAYDFEVAIRDIHPGEQLTDDYGYLNITEPFEAEDEGTERKIVYPDDLLRYHKEWDDKVKAVFPLITGLNQPLRPYISEEVWKKIEKITAGKEEMLSILSCYFEENNLVLNKPV